MNGPGSKIWPGLPGKQADKTRTRTRQACRGIVMFLFFCTDWNDIGYKFYREIWLPGALYELAVTRLSPGFVRVPWYTAAPL